MELVINQWGKNEKPMHMYIYCAILFFIYLILTVFNQWLRWNYIKLGQHMYIKPLPIPNLMNMHGKLLNALQTNDLIQQFLCTCIHEYMYVCYIYIYMCIISINLSKCVHIILNSIIYLRQMEAIIRCVLNFRKPNIIWNHNVKNVQLM
jgi:hypothetical protein